MERRHGARLDPPREPVAHHEIGPRPQAADERCERAEVIAVVGITHDHVLATGRQDPTEQGAAVAWLRHRDHPGSRIRGQPLTAIRAAIVSYNDLTIDGVVRQELTAFRTQAVTVSASLRHGISTVSSTLVDCGCLAQRRRRPAWRQGRGL